MIRLSTYAKLNLSLDVTGKRPDGYHNLDGIMQSISLADIVEIEQADGISVSFDVPDVDPVSNTAYAAARAFFDHTDILGGAIIRIQKRIPRMAGLGGASADAAAVLAGLNRLYDAHLDNHALAALGVKLGADVPFALIGGAARAKGVGEQLKPLHLKTPFFAVVVKPYAGVSTAEAFRRYRASAPLSIGAVEYALMKGDIPLFEQYAGNALGIAALSIAPEIMKAASALKAAGAAKALMSGSGSTMFAVFATMD
ncbi:MAG: 4-(cytidine 5'-diphospho)-2-C-methyl-D-erythritol kinase, partial [Bacillota bacterium]